MIFTQDFTRDYDALIHEIEHGEPFAFNRFADGERAIIEGTPIGAADGWEVPTDGKLGSLLRFAVRHAEDRYYLGLGCPCCDHETWKYLMQLHNSPMDRITTSNLLVNANWRRWWDYLSPKGLATKLSDFFLVGPWRDADLRVPINAVNGIKDHAAYVAGEVVARLRNVRRPILVAAGPVGKLIVCCYWIHVTNRVTIIDVGSAIEHPWCEPSSGHRGYKGFVPNPKVCRWRDLPTVQAHLQYPAGV